MQHRETIGHGVINGSLYGAAEKAGMTDNTVMNLADVFKYDIDFIKDIRAGDTFTVIYDKVYRDGAFLHDGDILAAEFVNRGHRYTAYRYTLPNGDVALLQRGRSPAAQIAAAHTGEIHPHLLALQPRPHASDPGLHARAQGRGLRGAPRARRSMLPAMALSSSAGVNTATATSS